jgi:hypothetical protein
LQTARVAPIFARLAARDKGAWLKIIPAEWRAEQLLLIACDASREHVNASLKRGAAVSRQRKREAL